MLTNHAMKEEADSWT